MMRKDRSLLSNRSGAAAAEMALVAPVLLAVMFGSAEVGNYFMNEHALVKAVRDGARYAARQNFSNFSACSGNVPTPGIPGSVYENTKLIVQKGMLDTAQNDLLPNWSSATFSATMTCTPTAGGQTMLGIYRNQFSSTCNGSTANGCAPVVTVRVSLPYRSVLGSMGFSGRSEHLNASSQAAVTGL